MEFSEKYARESKIPPMPGGGSVNTKQTKGREMNSPAQAISGEKYHHTRTESSVQKYAGNRRIKGVSIQYRTAISRSRKHFAEIHGHDRESKKSKKSKNQTRPSVRRGFTPNRCRRSSGTSMCICMPRCIELSWYRWPSSQRLTGHPFLPQPGSVEPSVLVQGWWPDTCPLTTLQRFLSSCFSAVAILVALRIGLAVKLAVMLLIAEIG